MTTLVSKNNSDFMEQRITQDANDRITREYEQRGVKISFNLALVFLAKSYTSPQFRAKAMEMLEERLRA